MRKLDWPDGFDRTDPSDREPYPHGFRVTRSEAFDNILEELRRMDTRNVQLDTGAEHQQRNPNKPYANSGFDDPGVVVRFERDGQQFAVPCDRWDNPRDNGQAIARYLDAKRALERYGVETINDEFATQALPPGDEDAVAAPPAPSDEDVLEEEPHEVLDVSPDAPDEIVEAAFRAQVKDLKGHPDTGGSTGRFGKLKAAREAMTDDE
ncbi:J domain-containing protein [Halostella sp. PRR32]|uniref:J domain-containing protein n=1 Tax=Halostella sp. PRR32 TaxID=3098147 RepID=UPI002B1E4596|nr:J domain-containing protein [Halostella sp. PRR32]